MLAMASYPTYQPSIYVGPQGSEEARAAARPGRGQKANYPALNRAIDAAYPPGSTFKPVTALAAMQEGLMKPYDILPCTPDYTAYKQSSRTGRR